MSVTTPVRKPTMVSNRNAMERISEKDYVPESFEDLFNHYYAYVIRLVRSHGIDEVNAEDVAVTILTVFFEKDVLSDYDPDRVNNYRGTERKAVFRTFLSGFVNLYVRHQRTIQTKHEFRFGLSLDNTVADRATWSPDPQNDATKFIDLTSPYTESFDEVESADFVRSVRAHLATVPARNQQDRCDLPALFDAVHRHVEDTGAVDILALSTQFGVSKNTLRKWMERLRVEIRILVES
jgi:hypothetical protein